jgi:ribonuclease R
MLPEKLSNGLCSLNPDVDRLAMVCDMAIDHTGEITDYRFYPAVFRSHARLTYDQVWNWLDGMTKPESDRSPRLQPHLQALYALFQVLGEARGKRGAIDFETIETMMLFNAQGKIENIVPVRRNDAHRLIEECMLAANVCASAFLQSNRQPCLYRIHRRSDAGETRGPAQLPQGVRHRPWRWGRSDRQDYALLLDSIKTRPDAQLLQTVMLRSLRQAMYSPDNVGHFGLSYEHYTHFTSPIRRYPDLLVHRSIKAVLAGTHYAPGKWDDIGCTAR